MVSPQDGLTNTVEACMEDVLPHDQIVAKTLAYRPLDSEKAVRFLELLPGVSDEPLSVKLLYDSLGTTSQRSYEAISYTWGDPRFTRTLHCDDRGIEIRKNAYDFLQRLRQPDKSRTLWMDCICIDQNNVAEREDQVRIMHLIYRMAKSVLIWLGPESNDSKLAMEYVSHLEPDPYLEEITRYCQGGHVYFLEKSFLFDFFPETAENMRLVVSFANLLCRPWMSRVWVQQEATPCSGTVVCCGQSQVSWSQLSSLAWLLDSRPSKGWPSWAADCVSRCVSFDMLQSNILAARCISVNRVSQLVWTDDNELTQSAEMALCSISEYPVNWLEHLIEEVNPLGSLTLCPTLPRVLRDFSGLEATDPRDKIYAVLNLFRSPFTLSGHPDIDYTAPWQTVYIRFAKWMYIRKWHKTIETAGRSFRVKPAEIPSWVPDWRHKADIPFMEHDQWFAGGAAYSFNQRFVTVSRARNGIEALPVYSYTNQEGKSKRIPLEGLELTAIIQDRICYTSLVSSSGSEYLDDRIEETRCRVSADLEYIGDHGIGYFTGESAKDAYAATLIANTTHESNLAAAEYERSGFAEWHAWLDGRKARLRPIYGDAIENADSLGTNMFCVTTHGLFCLVPRMTQAGDYVAILSGFKFPVALRKVGPATKKYYELLGPCYVHRLMRGRAWSLMEEFKCKYKPGSEDEMFDRESRMDLSHEDTDREQPCGVHPFNSKADYARLTRVMGKRRIVLV